MLEKKIHNKWYVFTLVSFGVFMSTLDGSIVNIALPSILDDFKTKLSVVEWVVMIYLLTITSFLLGCGKLSDVFGHKKIYIAGLLIFSVSSLACGLSPDIYTLIISRMVQGLSSAMIMACTPALLVSSFPDSERGKVFGINAMVVSCGLTLGPALGGFLIHQYSWRMIFYINVPVGIAAGFLSFFMLKTEKIKTNEKHFDIKGMLFAVLGIGLLLVSFSHEYEWGFSSPKFLILVIGSVLFSGAFIINEKNSISPILNLKIFKSRMLSISSISGVLLFTILFVMIFLLPFYLIKAKGLDSKTAGYIMMVPFAFLFFISPISGLISDYLGSRFLCTLGMFMVFLGIWSFSFLKIEDSILIIGIKLSLVGAGTAIFVSPNSAAIMSSIPDDLRGVGGAVMATARNLGMVLGIAFAGASFNSVFHKITNGMNFNVYGPEMEKAFIASFQFTMKLTALIALAATFITFFRGNEKLRQRRSK